MSNVITARDLAMVTSDIQYAQRQGARQLASNLIEIGRLLVEARTMVDPKDWEKYIWDNFGYSTSSADNWIKLYKEYGDDQESLFASFTDSQTFGRMSYTKLLALTAIPAEERAAFVEKNDVENMSTRQLQQAIKEREEALQAKEAAEKQLDAAGDKLQVVEQEARTYKDQASQVEKELVRAEQSEKKALSLVDKLNKQLDKAKKQEKSLRAELKKAQENPDIPDAVMEQMRKEVEADAAKQATADLQKQLAAAEATAQEATKAREAAEAQAREAEEKLAAAQKAAKLQNPDVAVFQSFYIQLQETWNRAVGAYQKVRQVDDTSAAGCHKALMAAIDKFQSDIAG